MENDLLKNSIADAKLIKEAAMLNAKKAIEESFQPHIKSMISAKLQEIENEELNESASFPEYLTSFIKDLGTPEEVKSYVEHVQNNIDQGEGENYHGWVAKDFEEDFKYWIQDKMDSALEEEEVPENPEDYRTNLVTEEDEELDLEEAKEDDSEEGGSEDEELDLDNLTEEDLTTFIEEIIKDMVENGELEASDDEEDEDVDLEDETEVELEDENLEEEVEVNENEDLEELQEEINNLRTELNESKLLNAKLLYVNKLYKNKDLSSVKKEKILEAFNSVKTKEEAKLTYNILNESIISSPVKKDNSIIRGLASKTINSLNENLTPNQENIFEQDAVFQRMKELAGL